jgi:hypothetical protein
MIAATIATIFITMFIVTLSDRSADRLNMMLCSRQPQPSLSAHADGDQQQRGDQEA